MKTMIQKLQTLGQKAAQIRQVVETAPSKVAQIRETLQLTAGQLQLARTELQQVATGLHVENDEDFTNAFREIAENAHVFQQAGYDLAGIDLEVSHQQRLVVHLDHHTSVPEHSLRYLLTQHSSLVTISSILSSIIRAESLTQQVHSPEMEYRGLLIHLGSTPAVRILWREIIEQAGATPTTIKIATPSTPGLQPATASASLPATSSFAQSSFFETTATRATTPAHASEIIHAAAPTESHPHTFNTATSLQGDWKKDALERLKNNPGVSKYKR
jgi:hypothetical protein